MKKEVARCEDNYFENTGRKLQNKFQTSNSYHILWNCMSWNLNMCMYILMLIYVFLFVCLFIMFWLCDLDIISKTTEPIWTPFKHNMRSPRAQLLHTSIEFIYEVSWKSLIFWHLGFKNTVLTKIWTCFVRLSIIMQNLNTWIVQTDQALQTTFNP